MARWRPVLKSLGPEFEAPTLYQAKELMRAKYGIRLASVESVASLEVTPKEWWALPEET